MDLIIFAFGGLAVISAGFLSVFSYLGYWQNKETWAIWSLYAVIIFTITAGFVAWQKRILEAPKPEPTADNTPQSSIEHRLDKIQSTLDANKEIPTFAITRAQLEHPMNSGHFPVAHMAMTNTSGVIAKNVTLSHGKAFFDSEMRDKVKQHIVPTIRLTTNDFSSNGDFTPDQTVHFASERDEWTGPLQYPVIMQEQRTFGVWGTICYEDEDGNYYHTKFCFSLTTPTIATSLALLDIILLKELNAPTCLISNTNRTSSCASPLLLSLKMKPLRSL